MDEKHKRLSIIGFAILLVMLLGGTYAFFNYTKTGTANNIRTGRIYFNTNHGTSLNLTNIFPMTSTEAANANLDTVTVGIVGDTTYSDGEEFEITLVDVNNTVNDKKIPMNYIATYTAATGGTVGTSSNDYWNARNSKDANIYTLNATGEVVEGKQVLVGYVDNGATGISGTLTIKAYIDKDRIAISDTYPTTTEGSYGVNTSEVNACVSYFTSLGFGENLQEGESIYSFCSGTGTIAYLTFQEVLDGNYLPQEQINYLLSNNIISIRNYSNGTTAEWVDGRIAFTTNEWNSLSSNPISFKIRAESNEGIWATNRIDTCPNCVYAFPTTILWAAWNTSNQIPTVLINNDFDKNFENVMAAHETNVFIGVKLNENNQIEKAYACGLYNDATPFCIEGYYNNEKYLINQNILQSDSLWNNTCSILYKWSQTEQMKCNASSPGFVSSVASYSGSVTVSMANNDANFDCDVNYDGSISCSDR